MTNPKHETFSNKQRLKAPIPKLEAPFELRERFDLDFYIRLSKFISVAMWG
jgi:hypothetical protein